MAPHGRCCDGDHQHRDTPEMGVEYGLYAKINKENLECFNESVEGSGKSIFKPWEERLNFDTVSRVMFTSELNVIIKCIIIL